MAKRLHIQVFSSFITRTLNSRNLLSKFFISRSKTGVILTNLFLAIFLTIYYS